MKIKFNGIQADIDDKIIRIYKSYGNDFDSHEIDYLIESSGEKHLINNSKSLKRIIEESMNDIISVEKDLPNLASQLEEQMRAAIIHS